MADRTCSIDGCERPTVGRGYCSMHWQRWKRLGHPGESGRRRGRIPGECRKNCVFDGCGGYVHGNGLCSTHHWQQSVGRPLTPIDRVNHPETCTVAQCGRPHKSKGYCVAHYLRHRRGHDLHRQVLRRGHACIIGSCAEIAVRKDMCDRHYRQTDPDYRVKRIKAAARRRARRHAASYVPFTERQLAERIAYYGGKCWMCRDSDYQHIDHVKPLSKGGAHILANLRPACAACNQRKHAKWPIEGLLRCAA